MNVDSLRYVGVCGTLKVLETLNDVGERPKVSGEQVLFDGHKLRPACLPGLLKAGGERGPLSNAGPYGPEQGVWARAGNFSGRHSQSQKLDGRPHVKLFKAKHFPLFF